MRVGIHSFAYNMSRESPVRRLFDTLENRGHEIVFLDTDKANRQGDSIIFPALPAGDKIDMFVSYLPSSDMNVLLHGNDEQSVPYFEQLEWLSARFPSPTPYESHLITNSKVAMAQLFIANELPMPRSYDGGDLAARNSVLSAIEKGQTIVFKPEFGGSGVGIVKVSSVREAQGIIDAYEESGENFLMQEYVHNQRIGDQTIDYRAIVVGDAVLAGIQRTTQPGEWRTNNSLGSKNTAHQFTPEQEADAVKALKLAKLGFGTVDIIMDAETGQHYICEINDGLDMSHLDKARPDLDLPGAITRLFEERFSPDEKGSANQQAFDAAQTPSSSPVVRTTASPVPKIAGPGNNNN